MKIKEIKAKEVLDSRKEKTICVSVKTSRGVFKTCAPAGKSTGKYEIKSYAHNLQGDIGFINKLDVEVINKINFERFEDLIKIERIVDNKIGGNSLFALEASLLKALAHENGKELWEFLWKVSSFHKGKENSKIVFPRPVGNAIGGGLHSKGRGGKKPDFQEFLFIANGKSFKESVEINNKAYKLAKKILGYWIKKRNDEGAWETHLANEQVLYLMKSVQEIIKSKYNKKVDIGLDIAASSFYKNSFYVYKNPEQKLKKNEQIDYVNHLIKKYDIFYVEDPLDENDFSSFRELLRKVRGNCLVVGDDLTTTNPSRFEKAVKVRAINAIIVKPNQIGSLLKVKKVIEIAHRAGIKTIISHRSGETLDDTIADLCIGFQCDFIKTGIHGAVRKAKLKRLREIERMAGKSD